MDKLTELKRIVLCFKDGQEKTFELPYSVQVYHDCANLVLAQLIIDLMNKVKALEDKIKKD